MILKRCQPLIFSHYMLRFRHDSCRHLRVMRRSAEEIVRRLTSRLMSAATKIPQRTSRPCRSHVVVRYNPPCRCNAKRPPRAMAHHAARSTSRPRRRLSPTSNAQHDIICAQQAQPCQICWIALMARSVERLRCRHADPFQRAILHARMRSLHMPSRPSMPLTVLSFDARSAV